MNGLDFAHAVRKLRPDANITLMSSSGYERELIDQVRQKNINMYLPKPFDLNQLRKLLGDTA
jgi:two-component SAPR family response regulator